MCFRIYYLFNPKLLFILFFLNIAFPVLTRLYTVLSDTLSAIFFEGASVVFISLFRTLLLMIQLIR